MQIMYTHQFIKIFLVHWIPVIIPQSHIALHYPSHLHSFTSGSNGCSTNHSHHKSLTTLTLHLSYLEWL